MSIVTLESRARAAAGAPAEAKVEIEEGWFVDDGLGEARWYGADTGHEAAMAYEREVAGENEAEDEGVVYETVSTWCEARVTWTDASGERSVDVCLDRREHQVAIPIETAHERWLARMEES